MWMSQRNNSGNVAPTLQAKANESRTGGRVSREAIWTQVDRAGRKGLFR
jgi:hypothetical protein